MYTSEEVADGRFLLNEYRVFLYRPLQLLSYVVEVEELSDDNAGSVCRVSLTAKNLLRREHKRTCEALNCLDFAFLGGRDETVCTVILSGVEDAAQQDYLLLALPDSRIQFFRTGATELGVTRCTRDGERCHLWSEEGYLVLEQLIHRGCLLLPGMSSCCGMNYYCSSTSDGLPSVYCGGICGGGDEEDKKKIRIISGFRLKLVQRRGGLFLSVGPMNKAFYWKNLAESMEGRGIADFPEGYAKIEAAEELVSGGLVLTAHTNRRYKVVEVAWDKSIDSFFFFKWKKGGAGYISFSDYYQDQHGIKLRFGFLPMIKVVESGRHGPYCRGRTVFIPPELCYAVVRLENDQSRKLTGSQAAFSSYRSKRRDVQDFMRRAAQFVDTLMDRQSRSFDYFGHCRIALSNLPHEINALPLRVHDFCVYASLPHKVRQELTSNIYSERCMPQTHGTPMPLHSTGQGLIPRNLLLGKLFDSSTVTFKHWCVVHCEGWTSFEQFSNSIIGKTLRKLATNADIVMKKPKLISYASSPDALNTVRLDGVKTELQAIEPTFVLVLLRGRREDGPALYVGFKNMLTSELGVPSQCIHMDTASSHSFASFEEAILRQMCLKMGASAWVLDTNDGCSTVAIGAVTKAFNFRTVTTFCASYGPLFTQHYCKNYDTLTGTPHDPTVYLTRYLEELDQLFSCSKHNNASSLIPPQRVILWRLCDKPYQHNCDEEAHALHNWTSNAFSVELPSQQPLAWCVLAVTTQNNLTQLVSVDDSKSLPPTGTAVFLDDLRERNIKRTFCYTMPHHMFVSTSNAKNHRNKPSADDSRSTTTKYSLVDYSKSFLDPKTSYRGDGKMQVVDLIKLTGQMCASYQNWPGFVKMPAPLMYADKANQLVGRVLKKLPHDNLASLLHFL